jgi:hypothetical protein
MKTSCDGIETLRKICCTAILALIVCWLHYETRKALRHSAMKTEPLNVLDALLSLSLFSPCLSFSP